jgi:hypothetical protein
VAVPAPAYGHVRTSAADGVRSSASVFWPGSRLASPWPRRLVLVAPGAPCPV